MARDNITVVLIGTVPCRLSQTCTVGNTCCLVDSGYCSHFGDTLEWRASDAAPLSRSNTPVARPKLRLFDGVRASDDFLHGERRSPPRPRSVIYGLCDLALWRALAESDSDCRRRNRHPPGGVGQYFP